jgi:hypothetical protein
MGYISKTIIKGDVEGYIRKERPRMEYIKQIMIDIGKKNYK